MQGSHYGASAVLVAATSNLMHDSAPRFEGM
jgi:hypothetical protein